MESKDAVYLAAAKPLLQYIEKDLAEFPRPVTIPIVWRGFDSYFPSLETGRKAVRLLGLEVEQGLHDRDADRALRGLDTMRMVNEAFDSDFTIVASLISIAGWESEFDMIRRSLSVDLWTDEQIDGLMKRIELPRKTDAEWKNAIRGERALVFEMLLNREEEFLRDIRSHFNDLPGMGLLALRFSPSQKLWMLDYFDGAELLVDRGIEGFSKRADVFKKQIGLRSWGNLLHIGLFGFLLPDVSQDAAAWERCENDRRFVMTALGVKRYRMKYDRWPREISELSDVGLQARDWTTTYGHRFGYEIDSSSALVWTYSTESSHRDDRSIAKDYASIEKKNLFSTNYFVARIR